MDKREGQLIETILSYSCKIKEGDKVIIEVLGSNALGFVERLCEAIDQQLANPHGIFRDETEEANRLRTITSEDITKWCTEDLERAQNSDVYIMIKAPDGDNQLATLSKSQQELYQLKYYKPLYNYVLNNMRWLSMRYPSPGLAKNAGMSLDAFREHYFELCETDYTEMTEAMASLVSLMSRTDNVRIVGRGTDVTFSIKNMPVHQCDGKINLPDGEVYTAPIKGSINGQVTFNVPSVFQGVRHENVRLTFENGRVVKEDSSAQGVLTSLLDIDEGSRYVGEFALGVNPFIKEPLGDILFDEKIAGSFHFALGNCYDNASNGNKSAIHWDLVCVQSPVYGGGEIYFDDVLVRKNGVFLMDALNKLNA